MSYLNKKSYQDVKISQKNAFIEILKKNRIPFRKIVIKKFEKSKGWLSKKLSASNNGQLDQFVNILEERSIWQRYGF